MSDLQTATEIVVISYCGFMTLVVLGILVALLVMKRKITRAQRKVQQKLDLVRNLPFIGKEVFRAAKRAAR